MRKLKKAEVLREVELKEATTTLAEYVEQLGKEPLIVSINNQPVAALIPVQGMDLETLHVSTDPDFLAIIDKSRKNDKIEDAISSAEMRRRFDVPKKQSKARKGSPNGASVPH